MNKKIIIFIGLVIFLVFVVVVTLIIYNYAPKIDKNSEVTEFIPEEELVLNGELWNPETTVEECKEIEIKSLWNEVFTKSYNEDKAKIFYNDTRDLADDECEFFVYELDGEEVYYLGYKGYNKSAESSIIREDDGTSWRLNSIKNTRAYWADLTEMGLSVFNSIENYSDVPPYTAGIWGTEGEEFKEWQKKIENIDREISRVFNIKPTESFEEVDVHGLVTVAVSSNEQKFPDHISNEFIGNLDVAWIEFKYINWKGNLLQE